MSIRFKAKGFLFEVKRMIYSLISYFLNLGIWLWTECVCLCIWNISLLLLTCFCSWVLQLITQVLNVWVVSLYKPVIHKLKILGGGKFEYYKSVGGTTKRAEPNFEISLEGGDLEGNHVANGSCRRRSWEYLWECHSARNLVYEGPAALL